MNSKSFMQSNHLAILNYYHVYKEHDVVSFEREIFEYSYLACLVF